MRQGLSKPVLEVSAPGVHAQLAWPVFVAAGSTAMWSTALQAVAWVYWARWDVE
jgi:hypothetical protein